MPRVVCSHQKLEEAKNRNSPRASGESPVVLDFWPPEP